MKQATLPFLLLLLFLFPLDAYGQKNSNREIVSGTLQYEEVFSIDDSTEALLDGTISDVIQYARSNDMLPDTSKEMMSFIENISLVDIGLSSSQHNFEIRFNPDTIWKKSLTNEGSDAGLGYYRKNDKWINVLPKRKSEIKFEDSLYQFIHHKGQKEKILGYKCKKITITKLLDEPIEPFFDDFPFYWDEGKKVYELWVTNKLSLPIHIMVDNLRIKSNIGFPLKAIAYSTKMPGAQTKYSVLKITAD